MEIRIQMKGYTIEISIGHETMWFSQIPFIVVSKVWYSDLNVDYATIIWHS